MPDELLRKIHEPFEVAVTVKEALMVQRYMPENIVCERIRNAVPVAFYKEHIPVIVKTELSEDFPETVFREVLEERRDEKGLAVCEGLCLLRFRIHAGSGHREAGRVGLAARCRRGHEDKPVPFLPDAAQELLLEKAAYVCGFCFHLSFPYPAFIFTECLQAWYLRLPPRKNASP